MQFPYFRQNKINIIVSRHVCYQEDANFDAYQCSPAIHIYLEQCGDGVLQSPASPHWINSKSPEVTGENIIVAYCVDICCLAVISQFLVQQGHDKFCGSFLVPSHWNNCELKIIKSEFLLFVNVRKTFFNKAVDVEWITFIFPDRPNCLVPNTVTLKSRP